MKRPNLPHEEFAYGKALRPSTPIREVLGNYYGEMAEGELMYKYDTMRSTKNGFATTAKQMNRRTKHTNKSHSAARFVSQRQSDVQKKAELMKGGEDLFKMRKFKKVIPRTDTHNKRSSQTLH